MVAVTKAAERALARLDEDELNHRRRDLRAALRREGLSTQLVGDAFALIRHDAAACFDHHITDNQLRGGWAVLDGHMAEMEPGEGKTLAAALAAATAALAGQPSHVICASDALARRHGERMTPLYEALGLRLGIIAHGDDADVRRAAYGCHVTYGSSAEMAFDYLRDRMVLGAKSGTIHLMLDRLRGPRGRAGKLIMRGLSFAVIDDAHDVLLEQARAPQAISGESATGDERTTAMRAFAVVDGLEVGVHFTVNAHMRLRGRVVQQRLRRQRRAPTTKVRPSPQTRLFSPPTPEGRPLRQSGAPSPEQEDRRRRAGPAGAASAGNAQCARRRDRHTNLRCEASGRAGGARLQQDDGLGR